MSAAVSPSTLTKVHDVQQGEGDNRTRTEFKLERHEMRHGHDLEDRESREINLAHENRDNIADNQAEQHGKKPLGGILHQQLESQAGDQRNQTER